MRTSPYIMLLLVMLFIAGCSQSGDFGAFVVSQVTRFGGHTKSTRMTKLEARWSVKQDANGFMAHVSGASFSAIDAFMREAFGAPKISTDSNLNGEPQRVWGAADIGVAIQLIGQKKGADIICIRRHP